MCLGRSVFFLSLLAPLLTKAAQGFYSARYTSIASGAEVAGNSVVKIIFKDAAGTPLGSGSAFPIDDTLHLWTAAHVIDLQRHSEAGSKLNLEITNNLGIKIFDTATGDTATLIRYKNCSEEKICPNDKSVTDSAQIKLSRPLDVRPLTLNQSVPAINDTLYSIGFPSVADVAQTSKETQRDAIYMSRATYGEVISSSENTVRVDMEAYFGQSGAPLLNDKGEIIGIIILTHNSLDEGRNPHVETEAVLFKEILK